MQRRFGANISGAAKRPGHGAMEIGADPNTVGLAGKVSGVLAKSKAGIRQIMADGPGLCPEPKMRIAMDGRAPRKAADGLRALGLPEPCS